jgi:hypothetical protein
MRSAGDRTTRSRAIGTERIYSAYWEIAVDGNGDLPPLSAKADPRVVTVAANAVIERAFGKPKDFDPKDLPDANRPRFDPRLLSPEQLDLVEHALRLMVSATRARGDVETVAEFDQEPQKGTDEYDG